MKNTEHISKFLELVDLHWKKHPELRFFQLVELLEHRIQKVTDRGNDLFYIEDETLMDVLEELL